MISQIIQQLNKILKTHDILWQRKQSPQQVQSHNPNPQINYSQAIKQKLKRLRNLTIKIVK